ncbi:MAG: Holliday junction branch migration protein RuvA [Caulobacter sp.]|nr:Holliday junction branch migration protein RuvA [Caulobacter sp.]
MIGRLRGLVAEIGEEEALIDVGGVGYVVRCGARTLSRLPAVGEEALVHVEHQWSEAQGPRLYGFLTREERGAFLLLQAIQGVGPKAAMAVLDVLPPPELAAAVAREDKALVGRAQGVGPKLALRIVTELKDKPITDGPVALGHANVPAGQPHRPSAAGEAVAALMGLGIAEPVGRRAVEQAVANLGDEADVSALIKAALKEIGR